MSKKATIIGDRFMQAERFAAALERRCAGMLELAAHELPWPDEPMEHGYAVAGMDGLKEYMGGLEDTLELIGEAEILITHLAPLTGGMMDRLPGLRMVAVSRGGPVNIDMEAARARGLLVVNTPGRNASAVAEFTIGAILAQTRNISRGHDALRAGIWRGDLYRADVAGEELSELTVGVIGYGKVGTRVVKLLRAFSCRVLVCDPYVQLAADDREAGVEHVHLERLLEESDIVTLHARVTPETSGFIDEAAFARMKPSAIFVNTARGPMVDYAALTRVLEAGRLKGAMLETFAVEPVPTDWSLLKLPNVTLTPHIAGASLKTVGIAADQVAEEVRRYLAGLPPVNPC